MPIPPRAWPLGAARRALLCGLAVGSLSLGCALRTQGLSDAPDPDRGAAGSTARPQGGAAAGGRSGAAGADAGAAGIQGASGSSAGAAGAGGADPAASGGAAGTGGADGAGAGGAGMGGAGAGAGAGGAGGAGTGGGGGAGTGGASGSGTGGAGMGGAGMGGGGAGGGGTGGTGAGGTGTGGGGMGGGGMGGAGMGGAGMGGAGGGVTCGDGVIEGDEQCDPGAAASDRCVKCQVQCLASEFSSQDGENHCYRYAASGVDWGTARAACEALGAGKADACHLATLGSLQEWQFIQSQGLGGVLWLGGERDASAVQSKQQQFHWLDGEEWLFGPSVDQSIPPDRPPWSGSEPDNAAQKCVSADSGDSYFLHDSTCGDHDNYLCECDPPGARCNHDSVVDPGEECDDGNLVEGDGCSASCVVECFAKAGSDIAVAFKDPVTHHCYLLGQDQARSADDVVMNKVCQGLAADLAFGTVDGVGEFDFLAGVIAASGSADLVFVDGNDKKTEKVFVLSDGTTPLPFADGTYPWNTGQPDDQGGVERCLGIFKFDPSGWKLNDVSCTDNHRYLCERAPAGL